MTLLMFHFSGAMDPSDIEERLGGDKLKLFGLGGTNLTHLRALLLTGRKKGAVIDIDEGYMLKASVACDKVESVQRCPSLQLNDCEPCKD